MNSNRENLDKFMRQKIDIKPEFLRLAIHDLYREFALFRVSFEELIEKYEKTKDQLDYYRESSRL